MTTKRRTKARDQNNSERNTRKKNVQDDNENQQKISTSTSTSSTASWMTSKSAYLIVLLLSLGIYYFMPSKNVLLNQEVVEKNEHIEKSTIEEPEQTSEPDEPEPEPEIKPISESSTVKKTLFLGDDSYEVLESFHHDEEAFTQGLTLYNGFLYEGTGLNGSSKIQKIDPTNPTQILQQSTTLYSKFFGEGITFYNDRNDNPRIIQLTWKESTAFIYDANSLDVIHEFEYETSTNEGWGITFLPEPCEFVVSDGSGFLLFWDCESFVEIRRVEVHFYDQQTGEKKKTSYLNELEAIKVKDDGIDRYAILANVWYQDVLLQIDPLNGDVDKIYFFDSLYKNRRSQDDCFNGISISNDDDDSIIYLTGKMWPLLYKVKLNK